MPRRRSTLRRQMPALSLDQGGGAIAGGLHHYGGRAHVVPEAVMRMLATVADTADARAGNAGHSWRVATYAAELVRILGIDPYQAARIADAARVHDMGVVDLPEDVLTKPGPLDELERALVQSHVEHGAARLSLLPETGALCDIVLHHHERVDGRGYPDGLAGGAIPFGARVIAVADSFDTLTHAHSYRPADFITVSLGTLVRGSRTYWDREIVIAFVTDAVPQLLRNTRLMVASDGSFDNSLGRI
jgi:HD-GYP domain-containing protein (c-di-GMP phosphodiesterase class II)